MAAGKAGPLKPFFSSPALTIDGKYLLIGQGLHFDADCHLLCFQAATGQLRWRIATPLHIEGSPAIHGDMVVAGAGAIEDENHKPKTDPGFVLAVRISDGQELWRYRLADPESSPAISPDGIVFIGSGFQGNALVALRSETDPQLQKKNLDRLLWRTPLPYPITGAVTLVDDLVIVGGGNGDYITSAPNPAGLVAALDARTGQVRWQTQLEDSVLGAIAAADGKLFAPVCSGQVIALNQSDGKILWRQCVSGKAPIAAGPALAKGYVYAVSKDGYLAILDAQTGKLLERHNLNAEGMPGQSGLSLSSPTVGGGRLFVGSETGGLRCFAGGNWERR
ncbi:MAG TPA: PQQ-binding-like beta-propeller repeat protein [Tepidisphaeraceae bacterium]|nr:PQQ-binding-like beta-propeller repeat protein [Tepidisphaeraceae bacterium]